MADEATRQQIVIAAQKYLTDAQPQVKKWLGKNTYRHGLVVISVPKVPI